MYTERTWADSSGGERDLTLKSVERIAKRLRVQPLSPEVSP